MDDPTRPLDALIIGGGVTGLALASLVGRGRPSWRIRVLERDAVAGGKMRTVREDGYRLDTGPLGVLPSDDGALPLARELGLRPEPVYPAAKKRWLLRSGGLRPLPAGPREALTSELLSPLAKLRVAAEPLVPRSDHEETVHGFLARRFGHGVAERLAEPLVLGITGGDPHELSFDALFPRMRAMEREHGSLVRAMVAAARSGRAPGRSADERPDGNATADEADGSAAGPDAAPVDRGLHGFGERGMQALTDALVREVGPALRTGVEVAAVRPEGDGWRVETSSGERLLARRLALALPAFAAAALLRPLDEGLADGLAAIQYAPMRVVGLGFDRIDVPHPLDGFGFLVPSGEDVRSLGVLFTSSLFPGQAPAGKAYLRALIGGRRDPEAARLDADAAVATVRRDLRIALGVTADPESVTAVDWPRAIPQYRLGHLERVDALLTRAAALSGLQLAGSAYHGVGVNDCVRDARRVALSWLERGRDAGAS